MRRSGMRVTPIDEERRLLYVGITRAREALYLMMAAERSEHPRQPSRFLDMVRWS